MLNTNYKLNLFHFEYDGTLPLQEFKYDSPRKVLGFIPDKIIPLVQKMIDLMDDFDDRSIVVDYRVRDLKKDMSGAMLPGYHLDCSKDIHCNFKPETHLIYTNIFGTKIATNPIDESKYKDLPDLLNNNSIDELTLFDNHVHMYDSKMLHNAPIVTYNCQRLLIRVTSGFNDRKLYNKANKHDK